MILALLSALLLVAWPANLTAAVGGVSTEARVASHGCWHDPESGYYLYKTIDCDGAHVQVTLTKDRRMVLDCGFEVARFGRKPEEGPGTGIEDRKLELATKNGIRIGMTRQEVVEKLGAPTRTAVRGNAREYWCALYKKVVMKDRERGHVLRNTYIFKHGKLIEIAINLDSVPGCGDDSLSDAGWPWSKF